MYYKYDFAISYASQDQNIAEAILKEFRLGKRKRKVYKDHEHQQAQLNQQLLDVILKVYRKESKRVLVLISEHYKNNYWTQREWEAIKAEQAKRRTEDYLYIINIDDTKLDGQDSGRLHLKWSEGPYKVVDILKGKSSPSIQIFRRFIFLSLSLALTLSAIFIQLNPKFYLSQQPPFIHYLYPEGSTDTIPVQTEDTVNSEPTTIPEFDSTTAIFTGKESHLSKNVYVNSRLRKPMPDKLIVTIENLLLNDTIQIGTEKKKEIIHIVTHSDLANEKNHIPKH